MTELSRCPGVNNIRNESWNLDTMSTDKRVVERISRSHSFGHLQEWGGSVGRQKKTKCGDFCMILQSRDSFTGVRCVQFHRACLQKDPELGLMSCFTAILKSSIIYFYIGLCIFILNWAQQIMQLALELEQCSPNLGFSQAWRTQNECFFYWILCI